MGTVWRQCTRQPNKIINMMLLSMSGCGWTMSITLGLVVLLGAWTMTPSISTPGPTPIVDSPASSPTPPPDSGVSPVNPGAVTNLQIKIECSRTELRKGIAQLSWKVAQPPGSAQRVEITIYRDGFKGGKFETSGLLPPEQSSLVWEKLEPGIIHYCRVVTLHAGGAVPSEIVSFEGPICIADFRPK
jgi:hypothetical protein